MAIPSQQLLVSTGATAQATLLLAGASVPPILTITLSAAAVVGATSLSVTITAPPSVTQISTVIANGTYLLAGTGANAQVVVVSTDTLANATSLPVEPLRKALLTGTVIQAYAGCFPMIGLENANGGITKTNNTVVLLSQSGWNNNDYSVGSWQFSGTMYTPINALYASSVFAIGKAIVDETYIYIERFLANGEYLAGQAIITDFSDTVQGAGYVSRAVTFMGTGRPIIKSLATL